MAKKSYRLGVIGGGFMATAILQGVINRGVLKAEEILVAEPQEEKQKFFANLGVNVTYDNALLAENCEYVLFAVKPQTFSEVAKQIRGITVSRAISIMAGVTKSVIQRAIKVEKVARAMPNLPCSVGEGMIGIDTSDFNDEERAFIFKLFCATGCVEEVEESLLNAVTGVSGSGPAYVYLFLKCLAEAGVKNGLSEEKAKSFALQTLKGGIKLVEQNPEKSLDELIAAVSSKGGTTVAALSQFEKDGWGEGVSRAVTAAVKRAEELSK